MGSGVPCLVLLESGVSGAHWKLALLTASMRYSPSESPETLTEMILVFQYVDSSWIMLIPRLCRESVWFKLNAVVEKPVGKR
jgi:hypothetical protein